jgi:transcription elongation factor Elf1
MRVRRSDGCCRCCGGALDVVDAGEWTLHVRCRACGEEYGVEASAFGPPARYYLPFLDWLEAGRPGGGGGDGPRPAA